MKKTRKKTVKKECVQLNLKQLKILLSRSSVVPLFADDSEIVRKFVHDEDDKIVGGHPVSIKEYPYQAGLRLKGRHRCGAVIISATRLLTAAHCIDVDHLPSDYVALVGSTKLYGATAKTSVLLNYVRHPEYKGIIQLNDIAILKLKTQLTFGAGVRAIALPPQGAPTADGSIATVTGWGRMHEHSELLSYNLHVVSVKIISNERCKKVHRNRLSGDMLCAGITETGGGDSCIGDNGGPLVVNGVLHGLVSWGTGCGKPHNPRVYVRVSSFTNWIKSV